MDTVFIEDPMLWTHEEWAELDRAIEEAQQGGASSVTEWASAHVVAVFRVEIDPREL